MKGMNGVVLVMERSREATGLWDGLDREDGGPTAARSRRMASASIIEDGDDGEIDLWDLLFLGDGRGVPRCGLVPMENNCNRHLYS